MKGTKTHKSSGRIVAGFTASAPRGAGRGPSHSARNQPRTQRCCRLQAVGKRQKEWAEMCASSTLSYMYLVCASSLCSCIPALQCKVLLRVVWRQYSCIPALQCKVLLRAAPTLYCCCCCSSGTWHIYVTMLSLQLLCVQRARGRRTTHTLFYLRLYVEYCTRLQRRALDSLEYPTVRFLSHAKGAGVNPHRVPRAIFVYNNSIVGGHLQ